ncbi:MAG TPA: plastocyanin/azurin family copper-binding protein [Thermoleophilaceae bacterium]|nr:plastocyanin/azurin family copper-binding protein [Thermoleophilaceae bacterium]
MLARRTALIMLVAVGIAAAGCGGDDKEDTTAKKPAPTPPAATGSTVQLAADPGGKIAFDKKSLSAEAGKTTIDFQNASQVPHAVEVEGNGIEKETKTIQGGKASLALDLKPGKYEFYCPVDGHKQQGMEGTLTVK